MKAALSQFELKEHWDSYTERDRQRVESTLRYVPDDIHSALDVGCGDGRFLHALSVGVRSAVGIDFCFEPLRRVRTERVQASATQLPFRSQAFDLVTCTEVLEHLPANEFNMAVREMARVASRYVMISVPFRENLLEEYCKCVACRQVFHKDGHTHSFNSNDMHGLGQSLVCEHVGTIVPIRKTHSMPFLYWLQQAVGHTYNSHESTRCPCCGGQARTGEGNLFGKLVQRVIWRIDKHFPRIEDGWIVAVYRKQRSGD